MLASGIPDLDALIGGFPRGSITEIVGPESSGRTTLANALLAAATARGEICCHIDTSDAFDPVSAAQAGTVLSHLLWVRCGGNAEHAFKAADAILHAGGFGVVLLDLARISERAANRIPISYWYRFRRAIENTPTILALVEKNAMARSCAALMLDLQRDAVHWRGAPGFELFRGMGIGLSQRKPAARGRGNIDVLMRTS
jgi:energy-coupling factor transporter ATP-binding protein EcfA2